MYDGFVMRIRSFFLIICLFIFSSCGGSRSPAPVVHYGQNSGGGSAGVHNVSRGDTLYSISTRYRLSMRDIVVLNKLRPPFVLREGQRLRLPPPRDYKVQYGDTLYGVSRLFGVDSTQVARMNDLSPPYILRYGQTLRMPYLSKGRVSHSAVSGGKPSKMSSAQVGRVEKTVLSASQSRGNGGVKNGVPIPSRKPGYTSDKISKPIKVERVVRKTPKRSSAKFLKPVNGSVISGYGAKKSGLHNDGINISASRGTSVKAAENGVVVYAGNALKGSGNLILLRHEHQWMTAYAHLNSISIRQGQTVRRGTVIGTVGSTGSVSKPQLHFEIRRGTSAVNPAKYME